MQVIVANKLSRKDSSTGLDVWYKKAVDIIDYKVDKITNIVDTNAGANVSMGKAYTVLFPFSDKYVPYHEWTDRDNTYTMSQDDVIFFDNFPDAITPNNIDDLKEQYRHCEVRVVEEREKRYGVKVQLRVSGV